MNNATTAIKAGTPSKKEGEEQLLLVPIASPLPRRGSLPASRRQLRQQLQLQLVPKLKRPPSTEIFVPSPTTREQDTPEYIRRFLDTIRPSDSEDESACSTPGAGLSPRGSLKFRASRPRPRKPSSLKVKSNQQRRSKSRQRIMSADNSDYDDAFDDGTVKKKITPAERKALIASTQLTELELVELWNQYKFNFPTGRANEKQLKQLIRKVSFNCQTCPASKVALFRLGVSQMHKARLCGREFAESFRHGGQRLRFNSRAFNCLFHVDARNSA